MAKAPGAKGSATREHILATATAMFGESGYRGASLRDIAVRAGITHPGVLYHFPTKESLLLEVLRRRDALDGDAVASAVGLAELERHVEIARRNAERRGIIELFATLSAEATSPDHPAHAYFSERYERVVAGIRRAYQQLAEAGGLRDGIEPDDAARQWVALMDGLQIQWLLDPARTDMARVLEHHLNAQVTR